jgi:aspartyl-tRNA(Asn)/glutamyl-tRNA(Gln) amidotransferase subunit B
MMFFDARVIFFAPWFWNSKRTHTKLTLPSTILQVKQTCSARAVSGSMTGMSEGKYKLTVGLEVHAELKTLTKMFSNAKNDPDETRPNVNVHPIDLAHPGTLPTINKQAVEHVIRIGLAVDGTIANFTEFDRKNYFYPDIPKGYQISQYAYPIVTGGSLNGVALTRIHLEEDTGTSKHDRGNFSLVDFNRAGVPLMELVTEPVIHSAAEAVAFAKMLQLLLRYMGAGDANMEKGEMRVEANISVSDSYTLGTKVEVKNLNSFKVVEKAIEYEAARMIALLEAGRGNEIVQETRGWDENTSRTFSQRKKESSNDYRYFPEPDLPKLMLHELFDIELMRAQLPELPWQKKERLMVSTGLTSGSAVTLVMDISLGNFFEQVLKENKIEGRDMQFAQLAGNYTTSDVVALVKECGRFPNPVDFAKLINMILNNEVSSRGAKDILAIMARDGGEPQQIAEAHGLKQESNADAIGALIDQIIAEHAGVVAEYKAGKEASLQFLIGQGMKLSKGAANPQMLKQLFEDKLK